MNKTLLGSTNTQPEGKEFHLRLLTQSGGNILYRGVTVRVGEDREFSLAKEIWSISLS